MTPVRLRGFAQDQGPGRRVAPRVPKVLGLHGCEPSPAPIYYTLDPVPGDARDADAETLGSTRSSYQHSVGFPDDDPPADQDLHDERKPEAPDTLRRAGLDGNAHTLRTTALRGVEALPADPGRKMQPLQPPEPMGKFWQRRHGPGYKGLLPGENHTARPVGAVDAKKRGRGAEAPSGVGSARNGPEARGGNAMVDTFGGRGGNLKPDRGKPSAREHGERAGGQSTAAVEQLLSIEELEERIAALNTSLALTPGTIHVSNWLVLCCSHCCEWPLSLHCDATPLHQPVSLRISIGAERCGNTAISMSQNLC